MIMILMSCEGFLIKLHCKVDIKSLEGLALLAGWGQSIVDIGVTPRAGVI